MNKQAKPITIVIAIVVVIGIIAAVMLSKPQVKLGPNQVGSPDGQLILNIPDEALPDGVSRDQISITDITDEATADVPTEFGDVFLGGYKMEPDGLTFNQPVEFEIKHWPNEDDTVAPLLIHISKDEVTFPNPTNVIVNGDRSITITGEINHFSDMLKVDPPFDVGFSGGASVFVGETFDFSLNVKKDNDFVTVRSKDEPQHGWSYFYGRLTDANWTVSPIDIQVSGPVSPTDVQFSGASMKGSIPYEKAQTFTCLEEGGGMHRPDKVTVQYEFDAEKPIPALEGSKVAGGQNRYKVQSDLYFLSFNTNLSYRCKEGECYDYETGHTGGPLGHGFIKIKYRDCEPGENPEDTPLPPGY